MLESGDWIQPHFNHARFYEKPPLTYWCVAASYRFLGFTEFASRLPSALAYVGTVLLTFLLALELVGSGTAPLAALIYATSLGPFLFGRFLFTDTLLVFCLSVSLLGLARTIRRPGSRAGQAGWTRTGRTGTKTTRSSGFLAEVWNFLEEGRPELNSFGLPL